MLHACLLIIKADHLNLLSYAYLGKLQGQDTMIKAFALKLLSCLEKQRWKTLLHRMIPDPSCHTDHFESEKGWLFLLLFVTVHI